MELIYLILAAVGGGIFASLIGGTNAFIFAGFTGLAAVVLQLAGGGDLLIANVSGGPFFGPHVGFNSGVVALAVYKRIQDAKGSSEIIDGTNTLMPLFKTKAVPVIVAAGITGALGYTINHLFVNEWALTLDTVAFTIVICNVLTRLIIGKTGLFPKVDSSQKQFKEVNKNLLFNVIWGAALSMLIGVITLATGNVLIGFYISALSLILVAAGKDIPGTHHITLVAAYAAVQFNNIWMAVLFGVIALIIGEYLNPKINTNADTLIDMPSCVIALLSFVIMTFF